MGRGRGAGVPMHSRIGFGWERARVPLGSHAGTTWTRTSDEIRYNTQLRTPCI